MALTQDNRLIAIDTPLGKDTLLLRGFTGREAISRLFTFELDLLSTNHAIKFPDIIGKQVSVRVSVGESKDRYFNGFISRFSQTGEDDELTNYRATMVPWLWFLTRTADCRIFQDMTIPDIILKIFDDLGFKDVRNDLQGPWDPIDYCVQYRETDFNFVSRLMEQYGIYYFFEHEKKKHTLVLGNSPSSHKPCPEAASVPWEPEGSMPGEEDVIVSLQIEHELRPGKYAHTDYNFETPSTSLMAKVNTTHASGGNDKYEIYDYPGEYEKKAQGESLAKVRIEEEEAQYLTVHGTGVCRAFTTGYKFDLKEYFRSDMNQSYLLTQVQHSASIGEAYRSGGSGGGDLSYTNSFTAIPHKIPYRPERITPKPMVQGPQTAVVVGPGGEEIYVDKYGRVKVQFFWDREGKKNESSSCWTRVSQLWAGKQWGAMFIPRIGQEVIVEFMEGDPDHPIITGRVYNAEQMPPYALPGNQTQSGIKSRSSKGGGAGNFNELRFEDKMGSEEIYLHAEKNWTIMVENDKAQTVGHDETLDVGNNRTKTVKVDQSEDIGANKKIHVGANHTESIDANKTLTVGGNHTETISGNESITVNTASAHTIALARALTIGAVYQVSVGAAMNETIGAAKAEEIGAAKSVNVGLSSSENVGVNKSTDAGSNISEKAGKNISMDAGNNISAKAGKDIASNAGKNISETAGDNVTIKAGKNIVIDAGDKITIQTGKAKIQMSSSGDIVIEGQKISVTAKGDIVMKGQKILQN